MVTAASVQRDVREAKTAPPGTCTSTCSGGSVSQSRVARSTSSNSCRASSPRARASSCTSSLAPASDPAASSRTAARTSVDSSESRSAARSGVSVSAISRQNRHVPLARISWLVTVGICLVAALLLLLNGYFGYAGVLLAVGAAAAVNLV